MIEFSIAAVSPARLVGDCWLAEAEIRVDGEKHGQRLKVSDTQRCIAGLHEPTPAWMADRLRTCAPLIRNDEPALEQIEGWPQPLVLYAEPN